MIRRVPLDAAEALQSGCITGTFRPLLRLFLYLSSIALGGAIGGMSEDEIDNNP